MTPHLIPIYGSCVLAIAILGVFAAHNRKTGWKSRPGKFAQFLSSYYDDSNMTGEMTRTEHAGVFARTPLSASEVVVFSNELIRLREALGTAGNAPAVESAQSRRVFAIK